MILTSVLPSATASMRGVRPSSRDTCQCHHHHHHHWFFTTTIIVIIIYIIIYIVTTIIMIIILTTTTTTGHHSREMWMPSPYLGVGPVANEQRDDVGMTAVRGPVQWRVASILRAVDPVRG